MVDIFTYVRELNKKNDLIHKGIVYYPKFDVDKEIYRYEFDEINGGRLNRILGKKYLVFPKKDKINPVYFTNSSIRMLKKLKKLYSKTNRNFVKITNELLSQRLLQDLVDTDSLGIVHFDVDNNNKPLVYYFPEKNLKYKLENLNNSCEDELILDYFNSNVKTDLNMSIGKFVKRIVGNKFKDNIIADYVKAIEGLTISYNSFEIKEVDGQEINYWYHYSRYSEIAGDLGKSCMRHNKDQNSINFYANFPNVKLVVLCKEDKLFGRALLWNLADGSKYLDRIYFTQESDKTAIYNYFKEKYPFGKCYYDYGTCRNDINFDEELLVKFDNHEQILETCEKLPYFDTFLSVTESGFLTNNYSSDHGNSHVDKYLSININWAYSHSLKLRLNKLRTIFDENYYNAKLPYITSWNCEIFENFKINKKFLRFSNKIESYCLNIDIYDENDNVIFCNVADILSITEKYKQGDLIVDNDLDKLFKNIKN